MAVTRVSGRAKHSLPIAEIPRSYGSPSGVGVAEFVDSIGIQLPARATLVVGVGWARLLYDGLKGC